MSTELDAKNQELKQVKALLEAHKSMLIQGSVNLRATLIHFQQALQEANQSLEAANKKIAELTPQPVEPELDPA